MVHGRLFEMTGGTDGPSATFFTSFFGSAASAPMRGPNGSHFRFRETIIEFLIAVSTVAIAQALLDFGAVEILVSTPEITAMFRIVLPDVVGDVVAIDINPAQRFLSKIMRWKIRA